MHPRASSLAPDLAALRKAPSARPLRVVSTGVPALDELLAGGGFPRGQVSELSAPAGLGLSTTLALLACAGASREARARGGDGALCAFVDPSSSLHGPGALALGVELPRLVVVRPSAAQVAKTSVKLVASGVFSVAVIDTCGVPGASARVELSSWSNVVRRLALAAEPTDTAVLLLTRAEAHRSLPLPVALRLELHAPAPGELVARVAKERSGLVTGARRLTLGDLHARPRARTA
ncbi:MAG: recombinase A [Polyangiaceae bacterium]|nr:recombinase A [Polyangiaceae bacterium]